MQLQKSIGLYSAIIALSIGVLGVYGFQSFNLGESQTSSTNLEGSHVAGHVTMFATAADGRITAYRQSDNLITDQGADCVNKALFAPSSGITTTCSGSPGTFNVIALGTGTAGTSRADLALGTETSATGLARATGTTNATSDSATSSSGSSKVSVQNTFTNTSGGTVTITEAGLFNSTNKNIDGMFAEEPISPSIALNNNDALTVKWTISLTN